MGRFVNDSFEVNDKWGKKPGRPEVDIELGGEDNILEYGGNRTNGITQMRFRRKLVTGDVWDHPILEGDIMCIFAYNPTTDELKFHGIENAEQASVNFFEGTHKAKVMLLPYVHAVLMVFGWTFLIVFGVLIACFVPKSKYKWWFNLHIFFQ